jgi:chromosome segregation ATPase
VRRDEKQEPAPSSDAGSVSPDALLERVEEQAERLAQARVRGEQLERALRAERERRGELEAALEQERSRRAALERETQRLEGELDKAAVGEGEMDRAQQAVVHLQDELQTTRMQLEAVRAELATSRVPLSKRLHRRSWR